MPSVSKRGTAIVITLTETEADRLASIATSIVNDKNIDTDLTAELLLTEISEGIDEYNG